MSSCPPDASGIAAETIAHNLAVAAATAGAPWPPPSVAAHRRMLAELLAELQGGKLYVAPAARDLTVQRDGGTVGVRVLAAEPSRGVYLHMHGGGWMTGEPRLFDRALEELARSTGLTVVSVDYRKAPEHPFPAALDDCELVLRWVLEGGAATLDAGGLVYVGGDSSGANVALATLLRVRDSPPPGRIAGVSLLYGVYDLTLESAADSPHAELGPVTHAMLDWYVEHYVADPARRRDPEASPLYADPSGLPPVLLTVGSHDVLLTDSLRLHERLRAAGVRSDLNVLPGGVHGFDLTPLEIAERAKRRIASFLKTGGEA